MSKILSAVGFTIGFAGAVLVADGSIKTSDNPTEPTPIGRLFFAAANFVMSEGNGYAGYLHDRYKKDPSLYSRTLKAYYGRYPTEDTVIDPVLEKLFITE